MSKRKLIFSFCFVDWNLLFQMFLKNSFRCLFSRLGLGWYFGGFIISLIFLGDPELWKMLLSYFDDDDKTLGPRLPLPPSDSSTLPSIGNISEGSWIGECGWLL